MKIKAIFGGLFALVIIISALFICVWIGAKIKERLSELNQENSMTEQENKTDSPLPPTNVTKEKNENIALGNPTNATANPSNPDNYLLINDYYALSYNRSKAIANWVAWQLTQNDFGEIERQNNYRPNEKLPFGWNRITPSDYRGGGFDRGHLCPSADRSNTVEANSSTFLMTNMTPQTPELNQGPWEKLETYSRSMARRKARLFIIAGQYGERGRLKNKITIPTNFWKIVVVVPDNGNISSINLETRIIAVDMPNTKGIKERNWRDFRTNVQTIEQKTGYKFFTNLRQELQNTLKTKIDTR